MKVEKDRVVTFKYTITDAKGEVLENGDEPAAYVHGAGTVIAGVEKALEGRETPYKRTVSLGAADAFGKREEALLLRVPIGEFEGMDLAVGMEMESDDEGGDDDEAPADLVWRVTEITDTEVVLDANHPFAGLDLTFNLELVDVREATPEELEAGRPDEGEEGDDHDCCGEGGCGHDGGCCGDHDHG